MHVNHAHLTIRYTEFQATLHKRSHRIAFAIRIMRQDIALQLLTKSFPQIRRIRHYAMILSTQVLRLRLQQLLAFTKQACLYVNRITLLRRNLKQRTNGIHMLHLPHRRFTAPGTGRSNRIMVYRLECHHIGLHGTTKIAAMVSTCLHGQRKARQLVATTVDVDAIDIVCENLRRNLTRLITLLLVHLREEVESIDRNVPTTHTGIQQADVLHRMNILGDGVRLTFGRRNIVRHLIYQAALRMECHPDAAQRILHHVAHHPVGREELCGSSLLITLQSAFLRLLGLSICLAVSDIELIEPTHHLHILTILVRHAATNVCHEALLRQQIIRQKQFRIVADMLKEERHRLAISIAGSHQQLMVEFRLR